MQWFWTRLKAKKTFILLGILVLAAGLRFYRINDVPVGYYWDEAVISYDAWGISLDGKDQWGERFPVIFKSFGDGKLPLLHYVLALIFKLTGFSIVTIRYLAGVSGLLLVWGGYLLAKKIFDSEAAGLITAGLMATSSWAIHFSRFGLEAGVAATLSVWGIYFLYKPRNKSHEIIGILFLALSAYTYHASLLLAPLLVVLTGWKKSKTLLFAGLMIPLLWFLFQTSWSRAGQTLFWREPGFHLSFQTIIGEVTHRIGQHVDVTFWINAKQENLRQTVPGFFLMFPIEIIFLFVGLIASRDLKTEQKILIYGWFVLSLVPSIIGNPSPHTIRLFMWLPVIKLLEARGWWMLTRKIKILGIIMVIPYLFSLINFWNYYLNIYRTESAPDYQYGYVELMTYLKANTNINQDTYVISAKYGQPYIYTLLFWGISPPEFRAGGLANVCFRSVNWPEIKSETIYAMTNEEIKLDDPRIIKVLYSSDKTTPVWVIAR